MKRAISMGDGLVAGLHKKVIKVNTKKMADELSKSKGVPLSSIVIDTGARDYGPPPNVSERRM